MRRLAEELSWLEQRCVYSFLVADIARSGNDDSCPRKTLPVRILKVVSRTVRQFIAGSRAVWHCRRSRSWLLIPPIADLAIARGRPGNGATLGRRQSARPEYVLLGNTRAEALPRALSGSLKRAAVNRVSAQHGGGSKSRLGGSVLDMDKQTDGRTIQPDRASKKQSWSGMKRSPLGEKVSAVEFRLIRASRAASTWSDSITREGESKKGTCGRPTLRPLLYDGEAV